ncbi:MLO-like protein 3 [Hibiscus syriacus]|uniref:MLO-like protein 3 n=1 Tax=Hibiscus syriacus TaxID=106335 RepID=UPI00192290D4|nr:MLO-like protein 3 [Hibiscus syriacus]
MSNKVIDNLVLKVEPSKGVIKTVNSKEVPIIGVARKIELQIGDWSDKEEFRVIPLDDFDFFIGLGFLDRVKAFIFPFVDVIYLETALYWKAGKGSVEEISIMATENSLNGSLEHTPTWAVATVSFVFISLSISIDHGIRLLSKWLKRRRKYALNDAVERLKTELMIMGFLAFLFTWSQSPVSDLCVPPNIGDTMLPCRKKTQSNVQHLDGNHERQLAGEDQAALADPCSAKGKVSLITWKGMEQLQALVFVLAVMQIVYGFLTMAFGRAKTRRWKAWEEEIKTTEYQISHDPGRFRLARQTTFARRHASSCSETSLQLWTKCFFRQFFNPVAKVDYLTLRHSFISAHLAGRNRNFNFQGYIERSLDEDFKTIVAISLLMWLFVVIFMLVDVHGWYVFFWMSFLPLLVQFGLGSCYHEHTAVVVLRVLLPITVQVICSYTTLPLYALVTQMGSEIKGCLVSDSIAKIMEQWLADVREKRKKHELLASPTASVPVELSFRVAGPSEIFPSVELPGLTSSERKDLSNGSGTDEENDDQIVEVEGNDLSTSGEIDENDDGIVEIEGKGLSNGGEINVENDDDGIVEVEATSSLDSGSRRKFII